MIARWPIGKLLGAVAMMLAACGGGSSEEVASPPLAPGMLDPGFGEGGKVITSFDGNAVARAIAVAPDGKIVAAGYVETAGRRNFALARYNVDGSLDAPFGTSGKLVVAIGSADSEIAGVVVQPDGRVVAAGYYRPGAYRGCALARFNGDGSPDPSFGVAGVVLVDAGVHEVCSAVALERDGRIVASAAETIDVKALRFNADGSVDAGFGTNGVARHPPTPESFWNASSWSSSVAVQSDGKILVVEPTLLILGPGAATGMALARFEHDGTPDALFARDGLFHQGVQPAIIGTCKVALLPEGNIVAAVAGVFRWLPNGALDPSFDSQAGPVRALSLAAQQNGKIVAIANPGFQVFRLMQNGGLDPGFGDGGIIDTVIGTDRTANAITLQQDGRIVVAGVVATTVVDAAGTSVTRQNFGLARYIGDPVAAGAR